MRRYTISILRKCLITAAILPTTISIASADSACNYGICPPKTGIIRVDNVSDTAENSILIPIMFAALVVGTLFVVSGRALKLKVSKL